MDRIEKAMAIADAIIGFAANMQKNAPVAFPAKRIFPKRGNHRKRRLQRSNATVSLLISPFITAARVSAIASSVATSKYKTGGVLPEKLP